MKYNKRDKIGLLFVLPGFLGITVFVLLPYLDILLRSFNLNEYNRTPDFENYKIVIANEAFRLAVKNTFYFTGISIPLMVVLSLIIAYGISSYLRNSWLMAGIVLPIMMPVSTLVLLWRTVFSEYGFLNRISGFAEGKGIDWINSKYAMAVLIFSFLWRNMGYAVILWIAGIKSVSVEILQAGKVDGANGFQRFFYIIIPNLKSYFLCIVMLGLVNSLKIYREIYLIAGEYPDEDIYMLQHLFNNWFRDLKVTYLSAGAVIELAFLLTAISMFYIIFKKE